MNLLDFLKAPKYKKQIDDLNQELNAVKREFSDTDQLTSVELTKKIDEQKKELKKLQDEEENLKLTIQNQQNEISELKKKSLSVEDDLSMESYGLFKPRYDFATALEYNDKLKEIRTTQKEMIKDKSAVSFFENWTVDGSKTKGKKMTNDNIRQILRSFNNECEAAINKVTYKNYDSIKKRIERSFEQLNKLNNSNRVSIKNAYLNLKLDELNLAYSYERKKEEEKEVLREQREREREEKKLQQEITRKKKIVDKDIKHYQQMIDELQGKLKQTLENNDKLSIEKQIKDFSEKIEEKKEEKEEMDYRLAHASAGYVYIISNIGAFGKNVFKIGVTRRLNPHERVAELSSASVPFKFDIHAMIFSYQAYELEAELHKKFSKNRMNLVNNRKEFFEIDIKDIEKTLIDYKDLTIDFNVEADADEYHETIKLKETTPL